MSSGQQNLKAYSLSLSEEVFSYLQKEALKAGLSTSALASVVITDYLKVSPILNIAPLPDCERLATDRQVS
jgi:hypothetical protein